MIPALRWVSEGISLETVSGYSTGMLCSLFRGMAGHGTPG